jgi:hypothetical protein
VDSSWPTNKDLNPARIANDVRFVFFRGLHFARTHTYRAGKHSLFIEDRQLLPPLNNSAFDIFGSLLQDGVSRDFRQNSGVLSGMKFQGTAMIVRWWKGPPIVVLVPSSEQVCIRKRQGPIDLFCKVPIGTLRGIPLTPERRRFLLKQGLDPELIEKGWVWDVSETLASQIEKEQEAIEILAVNCGLTKNDIGKIRQAKTKLAAFQPTNRMERMAKRSLEELLSSKSSKKDSGRPSRISVVERTELRQRTNKMLAAGAKRDEIVAEFAEEYGLRLSYLQRILEDRNRPQDKS